eukprot:4543439-Amphidinium_carterae.1
MHAKSFELVLSRLGCECVSDSSWESHGDGCYGGLGTIFLGQRDSQTCPKPADAQGNAPVGGGVFGVSGLLKRSFSLGETIIHIRAFAHRRDCKCFSTRLGGWETTGINTVFSRYSVETLKYSRGGAEKPLLLKGSTGRTCYDSHC